MLELKSKDIRLRGSYYTLTPVARAYGVDDDAFALLHRVLVMNIGDDDYMPDVITAEEVKKAVFSSLEELLKAGLVEEVCTDNFKLTQLAIEMLKSSAKKQNELDTAGFSTFPACHR